MQRYDTEIKYLVGSEKTECGAYPLVPFDDRICRFINQLSTKLLKDQEAREYSDIQSFAFWCRRANIKTLKEQRNEEVRIGRGQIFHIAPSNVPVNFAFSLVFGLLAGNANVVRVSTKNFKQVEIICRCIQEVLDNGNESLRPLITVVSYERDRRINDMFSAECDGRIIWGGDDTIDEIRASRMPPRAIEIHFADRFSFGILTPEAVSKMDEKELKRFAEHFFNDTYLMDQNACTSPQVLIWKVDKNSKEELASIKDRLYQAIFTSARNYDLSAFKVSEKFTALCEAMVNLRELSTVKRYENLLYIMELKKLPEKLDCLKGAYGSFFTCDISDLSELSQLISTKVQTCLYYGIEKQEILEFILNHHIRGIDRVVPFGSSLDIGTTWDGYNLIDELSRVIG
jgi:uncharacterized protein YerC